MALEVLAEFFGRGFQQTDLFSQFREAFVEDFRGVVEVVGISQADALRQVAGGERRRRDCSKLTIGPAMR